MTGLGVIVVCKEGRSSGTGTASLRLMLLRGTMIGRMISQIDGTGLLTRIA